MGLPTFKDCCCLCELKWGALIVGIVDILLGFGIVGHSGHFGSGAAHLLWIVAAVVHLCHFVACVCVIVSIWIQKKQLVIPYLITGLIRVILDIIFIIFIFIMLEFAGGYIHSIIMLLLSACLGVYFWFVIYSWYRKLGGSTPAD